MAKREKKPVHHVQMADGKCAIIQQLLHEYDIETAEYHPGCVQRYFGRNHQGNEES